MQWPTGCPIGTTVMNCLAHCPRLIGWADICGVGEACDEHRHSKSTRAQPAITWRTHLSWTFT
eukprot:2866329-Amphidinium_carterae.1